MWHQPAQSPFRRFAAAQVEGGSGTQDEPTALRDVPAEGGIVLVVDDEAAIVESLTKIFKREGLNVLAATDGNTALDILRKHRVGVLLTDLMMPSTSGMDLLRAAKTIAPETEVVLMTAYGTVETAVDAMKEGAYDFVTKPLKRAHVVRIVRNALEKQSLLVENRSLKAQLAEKRRRAIIGTSLAWRRTMDIVMQAAPSEATVLLLGESGTGKELLAQAIHNASIQASAPFVGVNVAAIPRELLESELFGYEAGAFTGARVGGHSGKFELAENGTLLLDEIGDMPLEMQAKLLRVLQERVVQRLGGSRNLAVRARVIATTHRDLERAVEEGAFRLDLFHRLRGVHLRLPPLRERRGDIGLLAQDQLDQFCARLRRKPIRLAPRVLAALEAYDWPGNVRELANVVEGAATLLEPGAEMIDRVPPTIERSTRPAPKPEAAPSSPPAIEGPVLPFDQLERQIFEHALRHFEGNVAKAALALGVSRGTLYNKIKRFQIKAAES